MEKGRLIGQGRTAEIFEWGENKILKLFRTGIPKILADNEYKINMELAKQELPIPEVYDFIELDNRFGITYERIYGITMMKLISSNPWKVTKEAHRLAELHKGIQKKVDFEIPRNKTRLKDNIAKSDLLTDYNKKKLYEYIEKLTDDSILCHGDFHPDNIIVTKEKSVIIDWMTATSGNPVSDIARSSIVFRFGVIPEDKSYVEKRVIDFFRGKLYSEYLKHYLEISGISIEQIEQWELPVAAARLIEGIPHREKTNLLNFVNRKISIL